MALGDDIMGKLLETLLNDDNVCKIIHGPDMDLWWLTCKFSIWVSHWIFDTAANARELDGRWEDGLPSLQTLCWWYLSYPLETKYETADWAQMPIPAEMLGYAATRVQVLLPLKAAIEDMLRVWF